MNQKQRLFELLRKTFFSFLLVSFVAANGAGKKKSHKPKFKPQNLKLYSIIQDACPNSQMELYYRSLNQLISHISNSRSWEEPLKASLYHACFLEMPPWKTKTAFSLAHGAFKKGYKLKTIEKLISNVSNKTVRIGEFLRFARLWEDVEELALQDHLIEEIFKTCLGLNYRSAAIESLILVYLRLRSLDPTMSHTRTFQYVQTYHKKFQRVRDRYAAIKEADRILAEWSLRSKKNQKNAPFLVSLGKNNLKPEKVWVWLKKNFHFNKEPLRENKLWNKNRLDSFVQGWISTPYKWGGDSKKGVDCSAFVIKVILDQFPKASLPRSASKLSEFGEKVDHEHLEYGDLVFFNASPKSNTITHVGIYMGNGKFAHASTKRGVTISSLKDEYYTRRFLLAKRLN